MKLRKTLFIAILFLLLAGLYYYLEIGIYSEKRSLERKKLLIFPFQEEDVEEIQIFRERDSIHLKKEKEGWELLKPIRASADNNFVRGLVKTLTKAEIERVVEEEPRELEPFGLKSPPLKVEIKAKGKGELSLLLGERSPTEIFYYAKRGGEKRVFLILDRIRNELEQPLFAFRKKEFVQIVPEAINRISINYLGKKYDLARNGKGQWEIISPIKARGDSEAINRFLQRIRDSKIKEYMDMPQSKDLKRFGLEPPLIKVDASSQSGDVSIVLGRVKEGERVIYASLPNSKEVVLLDGELMDYFPKGLHDLRNKELLSIDRERVKRIEWDYGGNRIVCVKTGEDEWSIEQPERLKADFFVVNDILWSLKDARIKEFFDYNPRALRGDEFRNIYVRLGFWEDGKEKGKWLILGREDPEKEGVFVRIEGERDFYLVDKSFKTEISKTLFDLRDKSLFNIERREVFKIEARIDGRKYLIERSGKGWRILEPVREKGDSRRIEAIVSSIALLKFKAIFNGGLIKDESCGLNRPLMEVILYDKKGNKLCEFRSGKYVPGKEEMVYGRTGSPYPIYGIEARTIDEIRREIEDLIESS